MARSKTSARWLKEHFDDVHVKRAREMGYRSRAAFKLLEINDRDRLLKPGMTVVDLGAAPGSWSQVAGQLVGAKGKVIASDILPMDSLENVEFVEGDFTEQAVLDAILAVMDNHKADLVICDMAPNLSGMPDIDQPRMMYLGELALDFADQALKPGGSLLIKLFQGEGFEPWLKDCRSRFAKVQTRKPEASRNRSREVYQLATGFLGAKES